MRIARPSGLSRGLACLLVFAWGLALSALGAPEPVRLIFDTDMQTDCDDAGALAVLHALADAGEVEILATMVCVLNPWAAPCTDAVNTYYGRPDIPVGQLKGPDGVNLSSKYAQGVAQDFPNDVTAAGAPDAVALYRQILAGEEDNSVVILTVGYMTNLRNLLHSPADGISPLTGAQLIQQKVKVWICMGGNFPDDYLNGSNVNFRRDPDSVIDCVTNWPGPIEFVGREIGHAMRAGARLSQTPPANPVRRAYELFFNGSAQDQHCADIAAVLYAVRGLSFGGTTYWGIQTTGSVEFTGSDARFRWVASPDLNQAYLLEDLSPDTIEELLEDFMIQPPGTVTVEQWGRFETELANSQTYADPYRDVALNVTYTAPDGSAIPFWGYYDGSGTWRLRFMPDRPGIWQYQAVFSDGQPGKSGTFTCVAANRPAIIGPYAANPRWFGHRNGEAVLIRSFHAASLFKFSIDDPADPADGEKRKLFLDWAQTQGYNTFSATSHFSTSDAAGPELWPLNHATYRKVEMILDDLCARGMMVYGFGGFFPRSGGYPSSAADRSLYIRYCLARFAPYWNEIWNVGGPEPNLGDYLSPTTVRQLGAEIAAADPFGHLLGVHNKDGDDPYRNDAWTSYVTLQHEITSLSSLSGYLLGNAVSGKPVYAQETLWMGNTLQPAWTLTDLRKHMWVHMMAAAAYNAADMNGNNESGFGGSLDLNDKIQARHDVPKMIWDFMETVPFYTMSPRQDLRSNGYMLADPGKSYLGYLPTGGSVAIAVASGGAPYSVTWINARDPLGDQRSGGMTSDGQNLAAPDGEDWLVYLVATGTGGGGGSQRGLTGAYYDNLDLTALAATRVDPVVDFNWGSGSPDPSVGADSFSVRWTGAVLPIHSSGAQAYTFFTSTNDGVRLWVNGQLLIDDWANGPLREKSGSISLEAGRLHEVRMEFYENTNTAEAHLSWESAGLPKQIIPQAQLFPQANQVPVAGDDTAVADQGLPVAVAVLANDADPDAAPGSLSLVSVSGGAPGSALAISGYSVIYTPAPGFLGQDSFIYTVTDGQATATGNVFITVRAWETFEPFQRFYFNEAEREDPAVSGMLADPDRDGFSNLLEYAQFADPTVAGRSVEAPELRDGHLVLRYRKRKAATDHTNVPEVSGDLATWNSGPTFIEETIISDDGIEQVVEARDRTAIGAGTQRFIRLRVIAGP